MTVMDLIRALANQQAGDEVEVALHEFDENGKPTGKTTFMHIIQCSSYRARLGKHPGVVIDTWPKGKK